jgi:hypothetical protein
MPAPAADGCFGPIGEPALAMLRPAPFPLLRCCGLPLLLLPLLCNSKGCTFTLSNASLGLAARPCRLMRARPSSSTTQSPDCSGQQQTAHKVTAIRGHAYQT